MRAATKALLCVPFVVGALAGCGGDSDAGGDAPTANELAAMLPDGGIPQAVAADVDAAREAAGLPGDADPLELEQGPEEEQFAFSAYVGMRDISVPSDNPMRDALDHGAISAYAGHPYPSDDAVTLVSTSQPFDEIASSLEDAGFQRDGDVLSIDGDPEELTYTAITPGDGFLVLGYSPETVAAVAASETEPSTTGELELLDGLDGPVRIAVVTDEPRCVKAITALDNADGTAELGVVVEGEADLKAFGPLDAATAATIGFAFGEPTADGDTVTLDLEIDPEDSGLANSAAVLLTSLLAAPEQIYDCG